LQGETESRDPRIVDALFLLKEIALILRDRRMKRGSIDFDLPEPLILFDPDGEISTIVTEERNLAHRIIEECMLAANETVAGHLARSGHPSIYRIHEIPSAEKIADFQFFIAGLGYSLKGFPNKVTPLSFQDVLNRSEGKPEKRLVNHLMLRSMKQAVYSVTNPGHFGLGAECYTHFTSPIRRYPDLMVHRILKGYRDPESRGKFSAVLKRRLAAIADHCSTRERRAVNAEREAMTLKKVRFMAGKIGLEFDGHISGVTSFGLFVELTDIFVEGLVPLVTLKDYYGWDPKRHRLTGERFRRVFQPGEPVRIRVESASIEKREIRFQLLNEIPPRNPAPDKKPVRSRYR
jgi:ribonuclease R